MRKKNNLEAFLSSSTGKRFFNIFYSWGASIVIIGALFKILHLPGANVALMVGMITEAIVFFLSGFDNSEDSGSATSTDVPQNSASSVVSVVDNSSSHISNPINTDVSTAKGDVIADGVSVGMGTSGSGTVIIGSLASPPVGNSGQQNVIPASSNIPDGGVISGSANSKLSVGIQSESTKNKSIDQVQLSQTAQDVSNFAGVMGSLNEMSSSLLDSYRQISESSVDLSMNSKSFVDNMKTLNNNILNINSVYETQLYSISEQMATVKYINESLEKIKKFYSDTLIDSSIFKDETEKMTKQIEALNQVYARLLRAMTSSGGNIQ